LDGDLNPQQREFAQTIRGSGETLITIINDILDFSKIEAGKLTFENLDFDLVEAVESTLDILSETAHAKGIELACEIAPNVLPKVRGDPGRLRQILTNLVGNAIKFTDKGEVVLRISVTGETGTHVTVRFDVQDTGIGISAAAQAGLFQAFSQADGSTTRKYGGTGLGLAIAKHLVSMMKGQIGVQSETEKGSLFWFTTKLEKPLGNVRTRETDKICDLRVLIVDDNATNRQILHHQLLAWNMQPDTAADGDGALKMMRDAVRTGKAYGLALLDFQMPGMDGLGLARAIKADPIIGVTRLVMLTSHGQLLGPEELREFGIDSCLIKPTKQARLFDCITDAVNGAAGRTRFPEGRAPASTVFFPAVPRPVDSLRILLADDNGINQRVAMGQLRKLGYHAQTVADGFEVIQALERDSYDLILMDCQMPGMDGYEATQAIREREQAGDGSGIWKAPVQIIAMTAHAMQGEREKCLAAGMNGYLAKPVKIAELQAVLETCKQKGLAAP
ncbi:MAG TPA: response regulator, partial [Chthoniobacterales bacterium]